MRIILAQHIGFPKEEPSPPPGNQALEGNQAFPSQNVGEQERDDLPWDEDLEFLGEDWAESVPSAEEIALPPRGLPAPAAPPEQSLTPRGQDPNAPYWEVTDFSFLPWGESPEDVHPVDPSSLFDEVVPPDTPLEIANQRLGVREKIWESLNRAQPLRIRYKTLPDQAGASSVTDRVVRPDYVYWADTKRHILVAWCHMRNDWRAFAVDGILDAELLKG